MPRDAMRILTANGCHLNAKYNLAQHHHFPPTYQSFLIYGETLGRIWWAERRQQMMKQGRTTTGRTQHCPTPTEINPPWNDNQFLLVPRDPRSGACEASMQTGRGGGDNGLVVVTKLKNARWKSLKGHFTCQANTTFAASQGSTKFKSTRSNIQHGAPFTLSPHRIDGWLLSVPDTLTRITGRASIRTSSWANEFILGLPNHRKLNCRGARTKTLAKSRVAKTRVRPRPHDSNDARAEVPALICGIYVIF